jgi:DNA (cytosine-5)-methyltransferase 1
MTVSPLRGREPITSNNNRKIMNDNEQPTDTAGIPTYLSLCSGYDGIGIALKRVIPDLRTIAHVEIEAFAICNLVTKMEAGQLDQAPVFTDLKRFPFKDLRERPPTLLSAGFPCQPFSSAGKRQATDDPRHLYPFIADGITTCQPEYVFLENVDGIVSSKTADGESVLLYVLRDLETRGYTCTWGTFSAAEIGAPHLRKRVFILAKLADGESIERQRTESIGDRCGRPEETVGGSGSYVADGDVEGLEGHAGSVVGSEASERQATGDERTVAFSGLQRTVYPSRPGERQRDWEEPRVVGQLADTERRGRREDGIEGSVEGVRGREANDSMPSTESDSQRQLGDASSERSHRGSEDSTDVEPEVLGTRHESYVADESSERRRRRTDNNGGNERGVPEQAGEERTVFRSEATGCGGDEEADTSEAQSELGGTTDGFTGGVDAITNRVDRLRLLGNGVVPDCAELAFRTLFNRLLHNEQ